MGAHGGDQRVDGVAGSIRGRAGRQDVARRRHAAVAEDALRRLDDAGQRLFAAAVDGHRQAIMGLDAQGVVVGDVDGRIARHHAHAQPLDAGIAAQQQHRQPVVETGVGIEPDLFQGGIHDALH